MYNVNFYFNKTSTGSYRSCMCVTHEFYVTALTDVIIEWLFNRTVKCVEIFDNEKKKIKLHWERN